MKWPARPGRLVSLPFLDRGGVLAESEKAGEGLLEAAIELCRDTAMKGLDFRGPCGKGGRPAAASDRYSLLLPLPEAVEPLFKSVGPKVRNQIRKSQKAGLRTDRSDPGELDSFFEVFARNMRDLGSPVHSRRLFEEIFSAFGRSARLYLTTAGDGRCVAGGVALRSGDLVTVPWASSLRSARRSCPNHSLYWKILSDAVEEGATGFDFGRSTAGTGTFKFKKQWGAEPRELLWSSLDSGGRLEPQALLDPRRNRVLADLWSRLPLGVANLLGPRLRGYLPN